ncbi:MAG TPA: penicillin-binding transpeptidase domain-containing protein, partial [Planctomycetota bacterium]|nr:penicillin-binding transpeptidase domain-containing protein [Planctomycetota bacterium]
TWNRVSCDCRNRWKPQSLRKALSHSCNSYFGQLGGRLGFEGLQAGLLRFGLITGSDERMAVPGLRIDASGLVPGERRSLNQRSIGYGFRVPPILLARAYAGIGTGRLPALHIIDSVDGKAIERDPATPLDVDVSVLDAVRVGLVDVPLADGTARRAGLGSDRVAAKTGTAEVLGKAANNASFAGYLPHDAPRLAFCVTFWECPPGIHGGDYPAQALAHFLRALDQRPALRDRLFGRVGR